MAGTTITTYRTVINNGLTSTNTYDTGPQQITAVMNGTHISCNIQTIPTSSTQITITAGVATLGTAYFQNLDATNYIQIGNYISSTFEPVMRLLPGEIGQFRLDPGFTPYAKANTASVELLTVVAEA